MSSRAQTPLKKALLPVILTAMGVWLLTGCVWIPMFEKRIEGTDVSRQVGNSSSGKPIRLHRATRDDVVRVLGPPPYVSTDGRQFAYTWKVLNGVYVWPLCFPFMLPDAPVFDQEGARTLVLRFDASGTLRSSRVIGRNGGWWDGGVYSPELPPEFNPSGRTAPTSKTASNPAD